MNKEDRLGTIYAVKRMLEENHGVNVKRGKYQRYSSETKQEIASYAVQNGCLAAKKLYSEKLGTPISESTIRNFVKYQKCFSAEVELEIGRYAFEMGLDKAIDFYSGKMGIVIKKGLVKYFKKKYLASSSCVPEITPSSDSLDTLIQSCVLKDSVVAQEEINGDSHHCDDMKSYYSNVSRVVDSRLSHEMFGETVPDMEIALEGYSCATMPIYKSPYFKNSDSNNLLNEFLCSKESLSLSSSKQEVISVGMHGRSGVSLTSPSRGLSVSKPAVISLSNANTFGHQVESSTMDSKIFIPNEFPVIPPDVDNTHRFTNPSNISCNDDGAESYCKSFATKSSFGKRGNYVKYSPEQRAEIGRYAAEHGNAPAVQHFRKVLGYCISESTVRGLKEKFTSEKNHSSDVSSLARGARGRPMRLGKYDDLVQDCVRDLLELGVKVNKTAVITVAKEVVRKHDPSLLEENGGSVILNMSWAKSFLKRVQINQKKQM